MEEQSFILNNRFIIKPSVGIVDDGRTGNETHIEPGVMALLCLLAENNERLVITGFIIQQIWPDHSDADENLTKAILQLRKVLDDETKLMIEAVAKKGYMLHARVVYDEKSDDLKYVHGAKRGKFMLIAAIVFIVVLAAIFVYKAKQEQKLHSPDIAPVIHGTPIPDSAQQNNSSPGVFPDTGKSRPDTMKR